MYTRARNLGILPIGERGKRWRRAEARCGRRVGKTRDFAACSVYYSVQDKASSSAERVGGESMGGLKNEDRR